MKTNKIYAFLACALMVLASCNENEFIGGEWTPAKPGDQIRFGATMKYGSTRTNVTRTVYGDKLTGAGGYTEIKWYEGDGVGIYCDEAVLGEGDSDTKYCEYGVTDYVELPQYNNGVLSNPTESNPKDGDYETTHSSGLVTRDGQMGLCWGTGTHTFYGVYPDATQLALHDAVAAKALKLTDGVLEGYLPNIQAPSSYVAPTSFSATGVNGESIEAKHYVIHPAMRHAYMAAKEEASPQDGGVNLVFNPLVAAVEMTLVNNSVHTDVADNKTGITLSDVSLINITAPQAICGGFKYDFNTITNTSNDQSYYTVGVPVKNTDNSPITLNYGDKITFTVFMLLPADLNQISVSIVAGGVTKTATLSGKNGVKIVQAKKKNFINNVNISLNKKDDVTLKNWVAAIPDKISENEPNYVTGLSIPGAGGAASKLLTTEYDKQQTLSIEELWERGIRCFEFMCDKGSSLENQKVVCGITPVNMTLKQAVDAVATLIKANPREFAVVILGYQDVDIDSYDRNAGDGGWGGQFHNWWEDYSFSGESTVVPGITHAKSVLTSTTTIAEARGKLFCIIRPMGIGIDGGWYTGIADNNKYNATKTPYSSALGWGTHPDQWYARGFGKLVTANGTNFTAHAGGVANRPYVVNPTNLEDETYNIPTTKSFAYKFVTRSDQAYSAATEECWVQDWRRVVPDENIRQMYGIKAVTESEALQGFQNKSNESWRYKWHPSVDEKWTDIVSTLNMSMADKDGKYKLYINSLCGYFVDGDIPLSFQPRPMFQRYTSSNYYYLDDKYNTTDYVGKENLVGDANKPALEQGSFIWKEDISWGPYQVKGGNEGNIAAYADWVNNKFYNLLLTKMANGTMNGPTGIVMMDRVSNTPDNPAGYYIPQIIVGNNFYSVEPNIEVKYSTYEATDKVAAPKVR